MGFIQVAFKLFYCLCTISIFSINADGTIKTDGDIVQLTHTKSGKVTQILLTVRQLGTYSPYQDHGKFDQYITWLLTRQVSKNPMTPPARKKD